MQLESKKHLLKLSFKSLAANIQHTKSGLFFAAGGSQFRSLWVRDFCYAVPGLLKAGYADIVENQLRLVYSFLGVYGFLPRGIDVVNPKFRVLWHTFLPANRFPISYSDRDLQPEYLGEHGTPAFDSNLLFLKAMADLTAFKKRSLDDIGLDVESLLKVYKASTKEGLLHQPSYSDWQDSVKRSGPLLLTNVLYLYIMLIYKSDLPSAADLEKQILNHFFSEQEQVFYETPEKRQVSIDSHWFILNHPVIFKTIQREKIYQRLKVHPLWNTNNMPGIPIFPEHNKYDVSWTTKAVGLRHYHDGFYWGWLVAAAYQLAELFNDTEESTRILNQFYQAHIESENLSEIYEFDKNQFMPARRLLYKSENPFTWSAGFWVDALIG